MICPYCRADLEEESPRGDLADEPSRRLMCCTRCETRVHAACAQHHGRCVTFGCGHTDFRFVSGAAPEAERRLQVPRRPPARRRRDERQRLEAAGAAPGPQWVPREDLPVYLLAAAGVARLLFLGG